MANPRGNIANLVPFKPGENGNPGAAGRGHFHTQALRMAREMTPAAIRRLGELGGLLPDSNGNWIDLEALQVDYRVVEIACMALVERTMGKPKEYDPNTDPENPREQFDVSDPTIRQKVHELLEAVDAARAAARKTGDGESGEPAPGTNRG